MKISAGLATLLLAGCAAAPSSPPATVSAVPLPAGLDPSKDPGFPSTYVAHPEGPVALVGATVLTGTGAEVANGTVLERDGKIEAVGSALPVPAGYVTIDAHGRWVTPGVIDPHSHLGVYAHPGVPAHDDGNELTDPDTAQVWAEHSVWPQDPGFDTAR